MGKGQAFCIKAPYGLDQSVLVSSLWYPQVYEQLKPEGLPHSPLI